LDRSVNATNFLNGVSMALQGSPDYQWFINWWVEIVSILVSYEDLHIQAYIL
jgi:hypothetical protein